MWTLLGCRAMSAHRDRQAVESPEREVVDLQAQGGAYKTRPVLILSRNGLQHCLVGQGDLLYRASSSLGKCHKQNQVSGQRPFFIPVLDISVSPPELRTPAQREPEAGNDNHQPRWHRMSPLVYDFHPSPDKAILPPGPGISY